MNVKFSIGLTLISFKQFESKVLYPMNTFKRLRLYECVKHISTSSSQNFNLSSNFLAKATSGETKAVQYYFSTKEKKKETFLAALHIYLDKERRLKGHVDFIYGALRKMEEYGVHEDIEVYKALIQVLPKGILVPENTFQEMFYHYPRQQEVIVSLLCKMEENRIIPDSEVQAILENTFGKKSQPFLRMARMLYWMPKFKYASPWLLPDRLPDDALEMAKIAIARISSADPARKITVFETVNLKDANDETWIVSAISPAQQELISAHEKGEAIKVEGPFGVYLRRELVGYFILRAEGKPAPRELTKREVDDVSNIFSWISEEPKKESDVMKVRSVHEQDDGIILAVCATGTSSRDSVLSWIRCLQQTNPNLANIPVLFAQSSPVGHIMTLEELQDKGETNPNNKPDHEKRTT